MNLRDVIGAGLIGSFIATIFMLMYKAIPPSNEQLIVYMLGQLSGFVAGVVAYHYVTKSGEKELDAQRVDNTTKALEAIKAAQESPSSIGPSGAPDDPLHVAGAGAEAPPVQVEDNQEPKP